MNYALHYDRLMKRARNRILEGYRERHHVIARCIGGTDARENIVELTPEEHYVAHQLLVKMYPGAAKLAQAAVLMSIKTTGNKAYGWLRRRFAASIRGVPKSAEHRERIGAAQRGQKRSPMTPEQRAKTELLLRVYRQRRKYGPLSDKHKAKLAAVMTGRTHTLKSRAKMSAAQRGNKNNLGKKHSLKTLEKIAAAKRVDWKRKKASGYTPVSGWIHSPEARANMSAARRAVIEKKAACA